MTIIDAVYKVCRTRRDAGLPVAMTIAERHGVSGEGAGFPVPDDAPIPFSLATLRACRPDMEDAPPPDTAAIVDTLLRQVTAGWTLTARGKARVRDGIVRGLVEAGVVR